MFLCSQSEYFHELSLEPVISSLVAHEGVDSNGGHSIHVDLHCTVNGVERVRNISPLWPVSYRAVAITVKVLITVLL